MSELNLEIAEKIMGWKLCKGGVTWHTGGMKKTVDDWRPDTDIGDAWLVVEKMREKGWVMFEISVDGSGLWFAAFGKKFGEGSGTGSKSAAEEICLSALEAIAEKPKKTK